MREKHAAFASGILLITIAFLASAFSIACAGQRGAGPSLADVKALPYKHAGAYCADAGARLALPLVDRIEESPKVLIDYLRGADGNPSYSAYLPSESERSLAGGYLALIPPRIGAVMEAKLLGIYFIENFAGGGLSDYVFAGDGAMYCVLVLNPKVLRLTLSEWIAYRDGSPYADDGTGAGIRSACAGSGDYKGLLHTLSHEAAHIYDYFEHVTPFVEPRLGSASDLASSRDFTRGIWESYAKPVSAYAVPERERLAPYGLGKALPASSALAQYEALGRTPFFSLYGSASWAEDFAEALAWTLLRDRLGISYEVAVYRPGREALRFTAGGHPGPAARVAAIRAALD